MMCFFASIDYRTIFVDQNRVKRDVDVGCPHFNHFKKVLQVGLILSIRLMASSQNIAINCATQQSSECLG